MIFGFRYVQLAALIKPRKGERRGRRKTSYFVLPFHFFFLSSFSFEKSTGDFESLVHVFTSIIGRRLRVVPEVPRWNNATGNNLVGPPFSLFHATGGTDETMVERWERGEKEREREEGQTMTHTRRDPCNMPMHSMNCRNRSGAILSQNVNHEPSLKGSTKKSSKSYTYRRIYICRSLSRINKHFSSSFLGNFTRNLFLCKWD